VFGAPRLDARSIIFDAELRFADLFTGKAAVGSASVQPSAHL
jgi:hypothetical protein